MTEAAAQTLAIHGNPNSEKKQTLLHKKLEKQSTTQDYFDVNDIELTKVGSDNAQKKWNRSFHKTTRTITQAVVKNDSNESVFDFLDTDKANIYIKWNFSYQYQIYLQNLNFKRIYDILILLVFFILFMRNIRTFIDGLN